MCEEVLDALTQNFGRATSVTRISEDQLPVRVALAHIAISNRWDTACAGYFWRPGYPLASSRKNFVAGRGIGRPFRGRRWETQFEVSKFSKGQNHGWTDSNTKGIPGRRSDLCSAEGDSP
jgi:hypothetical protein